MKTLTLTIGHNVGDKPTHTSAHVVNAAADILALDGLTAYEARGMWRGMFEDSTSIEVSGISEQEAARIMDALPALAYMLKQEAIAADVREDTTQFVAAYNPASARTA